jgi:mono/diheme cytochrome c family protein
MVGLVVPKKPRRKVRAIIEAMNTGSKVQMNAATRARFDAIYRDDVAYVESLLERPLKVWDRD